MFGSRRRRAASSQLLNGRNANPNAATAAAAAFLKDRSSSTSLSAAAAAAALRARPTTPTSVADVQTKRTLRRTGSNSSAGSSNAGGGRGPPGAQLQRTSSSGSMTDRTFRSPSPSRSKGVPSTSDAPPVPAIPADMQQPPLPPKSHRRAASMEARRVASPPPQISHGRGSSLGPGSQGQLPRNPRAPSLSIVQELTGIERPASRGSVNFSLPTHLRPTSPDEQRPLTSFSSQSIPPARVTTAANRNMVYDPNTRSFLPEIQVLNITQRVQDAANQPVKKAKRIASNQATGTHLEDGTVGGRIKGTAVDALQRTEKNEVQDAAPRVPDPTTSSQMFSGSEPQPSQAPAGGSQAQAAPAPRKKKTRLVPQRSGLGMVVASDSDSDQPYGMASSDNDSDGPSRSARDNNYSGAKLSKKPSVVREDREREEEEDDTPKRTVQRSALPKLNTNPGTTRRISATSIPRSQAGRGRGRGNLVAPVAVPQPDPESTTTQPIPAPASAPKDVHTSESVAVASAIGSSIKNERMHSVSPVRTTHFASTPDNLMVRHQPPARSVSPRKSALKNSNSPRGPSPVPGVDTDDYTRPLSETSNDPSLTYDDQHRARKKAVRVSFDESNVAVIEPPAAADSPASNQTKRTWFSLGRGKKKDVTISEPEDDEVMKPRPTLPSFGSVRERKKRETTERQLVKPGDSTQVKTTPVLPTSPVVTPPEHVLGQSNDYLAGAILAQDAASKNEANISKSREPLPPQVTSVEGSGYHSDSESSASSCDEKAVAETIPAESLKRSPEEGLAEAYTALTGESSASVKPLVSVEPQEPKIEIHGTNGEIPKINVVHPTPNTEATPKRAMSPMPGSWDNSSWDSTDEQNEDDMPTPKASPLLAATHLVEDTPALAGIAEPTPETHKPVVHETAAENHPLAPALMHNPEDSDASSIYSDAAEDLSDADEGDGFLSLDAVVESPVMPQSLGRLALNSPPESPTARLSKGRAIQRPQEIKAGEPALDEGWEKAQEYWKGLSADKKRQLEHEAHPKSDGSDTEVEAKPAPKPSRKKKVDVVATPVAVAQQRQPAPQKQRAYQIAPGTKAAPVGPTPVIRTSMRAEPAAVAPETYIRKSMRGSDSMRGSLRGPVDPVPVKSSLQKKYRPMSLPSTEIKADPAAVKQHVRALSAATASINPQSASKSNAPPLLRRKSSADSDSSFKRTRPSSEGFFLRRSMRGSDPPPMGRQPSPMRTGGFSLRSPTTTDAAPTRQPFSRTSSSAAIPNSMPPQAHMRTSMRSSYGDSGPTLRASGPSSRGKSPLRIPGFGRSSAKPAKSKPVPQRASRFANSSDEEDNQPTFRSRFVDSSDEEGDSRPQRPTALPKTMRSSQPHARATPRREDQDSSDLPDSDDEKSPRLAAKAFTGLGNINKARITNGTSTTNGTTKTNKQGLALSSGSLRRSGSGRGTLASPPNPASSQAHTTTTISGPPLSAQRPGNSRRTSSFMSILRRKKKDPNPNTKVRKSEVESPARRDTRLERSESELKALRAGQVEDSEGRFADQDDDADGQGKEKAARMGIGLRSMSAGSWSFGGGERPKSPRLQKRRTLSRGDSSNTATGISAWPLPAASSTITPGIEGKDEETGGLREDHGDGEGQNGGNNDDDAESAGLSFDGPGGGNVNGMARKKKKFGKLRRLFGLDE